MRRGYDPEFVKFRHDAKIAGVVFAITQAILFGWWWHTNDAQITRIDDLTMRLHDTGCANSDTLHRLIGTRSLNRVSFRRLGFSDIQIAGLAAELQKAKDRDLALLGERDPTCPPVKEP